jgi:N-acetylglutamate synthase-like GNAT family acetyltransferase
MNIEISNAPADDSATLAEVIALLHRVNLPDEGVAQHFRQFLLARADNKIIGCVGLEIYGEAALLRSLAVAPEQQKTGLGRRLTEQALELARTNGLHEIALLTTTAAEFFKKEFGFQPAERKLYEERFAQSIEWHLPRCATALFLALTVSFSDLMTGGIPA